jgi:hypothetical protein
MKQIKLRIRDEKLWNDFKEYVHFKHGNGYGVTSLEHERALYLFLKHENWKDYGESNQPIPGRDAEGNSTHKKLKPRQIKFLKSFDVHFINYDTISDKELKDFIRTELSVKDNRPIKGWIEFLEALKWIKEIPRKKSWENTTPLKWEEELLGGAES